MTNKRLKTRHKDRTILQSTFSHNRLSRAKCLMASTAFVVCFSIFPVSVHAGVMPQDGAAPLTDLTVPPIINDDLSTIGSNVDETLSQAQDANFDDLEAALQKKTSTDTEIPMPDIDLKKQKAAQKPLIDEEATAFNDKPELSLSTAILFALHDNTNIDISKEKQQQAAYAVKETMSAIYPQVEATLLAGHEYNNPAIGQAPGKSAYNNTYGMKIYAEQLLFDGESTYESIMQKEQILAASKIQTDVTTEKVITDTIKFYLQVARYQRTLNASSRLINRLNGISEKVEIMKEAGDASQAKVDYTKARLAYAKSQINNSVSALNDARHNLETYTGKLPDFNASYPDRLEFELYSLEEYLDLGGRHNSQIRVNETERHALEHQYNAEKGKMFPTLSFTLFADQKFKDGGQTPRRREIQGSFETKYKIFDGWSRKATANKVKSQLNEQDIKKRKITEDLTRDIKRSYSQLSSLEYALSATEDEIKSNRSVQALNLENFELGNIDIIELIQGEERLSVSLSNKYKLTSDYYLNMHRLMIAVGLLRKNYFCASC